MSKDSGNGYKYVDSYTSGGRTTICIGAPCLIKVGAGIGSYPAVNVGGGYHATARPYIAGLDGRFESSQLVVPTNPYLSSSSSFPTFTPPMLPPPPPFPDQLSGSGNHNGSGYSLTAIQNLPRIATDTEFAATGHCNIAVESIVHHAVQQNSTGKGINAIASLQMINLSHNKLNDNDLFNLNTGLLGYTLNLKVFNLSYNNFGDAGIDYLIKGLAGVQYLQAGGRELSRVMQGLFTHYNVNITTINLSNNHIGDIGADIISNAIVTNSLPHVKVLNLADNNITDTGAVRLANSLISPSSNLKVLHLEGNRLTSTGEGYLVIALQNVTQSIKVVLKEVKGFSKDSLKVAMKAMLSVAKSNGITTKEMLTNDETIENCKNGTFNVGKNIAGGIVTCFTPAGTIVDIAELNIGSLMRDAIGVVFNPVKKVNTFLCVTEEAFTSIIDEDFANCLVGVDSMLNE